MALQHLTRDHRMRGVSIIKQGGKTGISEVYNSREDNQQNNRGRATPFRIA
jgi:hypothetical protein